MHGQGAFYDPRLDEPARFPIAPRARFGHVTSAPDRITPKRFAALEAVVAHYDRTLGLGLAVREPAELVEFLRSLKFRVSWSAHAEARGPALTSYRGPR